MPKPIPKSLPQNKILPYLILALAVLTAFVSGRYMGSRELASMRGNLEEASRILSKKPYPMLAGEILGIDGNRLTIRTLNWTPLDNVPEKRELIVAESTDIRRIERKTGEEMRKDWAVYQRQVAAATSGLEILFPSPTTIREISFTDLKVGDFIHLETASDIGAEERLQPIKITVRMNP